MPSVGNRGYQDVGLDPLLWKDLGIRQEKYRLGSETPLDLCTYLFTDLSTSPNSFVLPPNVSLDVELHPAIPQKSIIMDKIGLADPVAVITKAELIVPRVTPAHSLPRSITHQYMKTTAQPIFIPEGTTNYHGIVTFAGPIPSRLTILFASMNSFDGNFGDNLYASVPRNIEKIDFNVAGSHYPVTPVRSHFPKNALSEMYLRTAESLRFSLDRTQRTLPKLDDYAAREFIYSVDISPDYSADSTWISNPDHAGSVAVSMHFSSPTPDQTVAILIAETVTTLSITSSGDIEVE